MARRGTRRGVAVLLAAALIAGCTGAEDDVEVLANVEEDPDRVVVDDEPEGDLAADDAADPETPEPEVAPDGSEESDDEVEVLANVVEADEDEDEVAAPTPDADASPEAPTTTTTTTTTTTRRTPLAADAGPPPARPAPAVLTSRTVGSAGFLASLEGDWVAGSSASFDPDTDPDPLQVEMTSTPVGDDERVVCRIRLAAPASGGLTALGEVTVSVLVVEGDTEVRTPRQRIPIDARLGAGDVLELPVSAPWTASHGAADRWITCEATFTAG